MMGEEGELQRLNQIFVRMCNVGATYSETVLFNEYRVVVHQLCHSLRILEVVQRVQLDDYRRNQ